MLSGPARAGRCTPIQMYVYGLIALLALFTFNLTRLTATPTEAVPRLIASTQWPEQLLTSDVQYRPVPPTLDADANMRLPTSQAPVSVHRHGICRSLSNLCPHQIPY